MAIRQHDEQYVMPIREHKRPTRSVSPIYGTLLAAAAGLIFFVIQSEKEPVVDGQNIQWAEPAEYFRFKGGLNVEFFLNRAGQVERARDESIVHPGDRVGFRVSTPVAGHLMIVGQDQSGVPYLCYPQDTSGRANEFGPTQAMVPLEQAIVLDEVLGQERLRAIFCAQSFDFDTVRQALKSDQKNPGENATLNSHDCRERVIRLRKQTPAEIP